ncbi:MAG TPA: radical SAM protein [Planctomycetota bacterium]|jgi:uncharacterized protein
MKAALFLTGQCNLRCSYCFASECPSTCISHQALEQSVRFLRTRADDGLSITIFGGEPLLRRDLVDELIALCFAPGASEITLAIATNGTLLDQRFLDICRQRNIRMFLSLDGVREAHDVTRRQVSGLGSFDMVVEKVPRILSALPYAVAVAVITPQTAALVSESIEFLFSLGFRYVLMTPDFNGAWRRTDLAILRSEYLRAAELYKARLRRGEKTYLSLFDEWIKTRTAEKNTPENCCDLANTTVAIGPSGRIYPCVQFVGRDNGTNAIGDVATGMDETARRRLVCLNHSPRDGCEGCALDGRCFNWCGCVNWRGTGRINQVPAFVCEHERMLLPIADSIGDELFSERNELFLRKFYDSEYTLGSLIEDSYLPA